LYRIKEFQRLKEQGFAEVLPQSDRLTKLNALAISQMKVLLNTIALRNLKTSQ
jgi:hypothetical protein